MKTFTARIAGSLLGLTLALSTSHAVDIDEFEARENAPPAKRTEGAARSGSDDADAARIVILAPSATVGMTSNPAPIVYYSVSIDTKNPIEIGLTDPRRREDPMVSVKIPGPTKAGVHTVDFSKLEKDGKPVVLDPKVQYRLALSINSNAKNASENPTTTCKLMLADDKATAAAIAKGTDPAKRASLAAKSGLWFDYVAALQAARTASPKDETLAASWAKAMEKQGLSVTKDGTVVPTAKP